MSSTSHFELGDALEDQGRLEEAFAEFTAGAEAGDASCMTRLALLYSLGKGVNCCDYDKAIEWETKAHAAGYPMALFNLGITYRIKGDLLQAKTCFERALAEGDNSAALELAKLYLVSPKETETVKRYLSQVITDNSLCESEREAARKLLSEIRK
jgi:TPR repeat protein